MNGKICAPTPGPLHFAGCPSLPQPWARGITFICHIEEEMISSPVGMVALRALWVKQWVSQGLEVVAFWGRPCCKGAPPTC